MGVILILLLSFDQLVVSPHETLIALQFLSQFFYEKCILLFFCFKGTFAFRLEFIEFLHTAVILFFELSYLVVKFLGLCIIASFTVRNVDQLINSISQRGNLLLFTFDLLLEPILERLTLFSLILELFLQIALSIFVFLSHFIQLSLQLLCQILLRVLFSLQLCNILMRACFHEFLLILDGERLHFTGELSDFVPESSCLLHGLNRSLIGSIG
mmetsp:Transcript_778/g.2617  ORF Transcript_778/g.2617 Transcript_778/m.2617 type:complete len:213 (+) Transcript_778:1037-1675(+)